MALNEKERKSNKYVVSNKNVKVVHEEEDGGGGDDDEGFSKQFSSVMLEIYQVELLRRGNYQQHRTQFIEALNEKRVHEEEDGGVVLMIMDFRAIFIYHVRGIPSRPPKRVHEEEDGGGGDDD
ncbi:unnamed protein product [Dovyalis caffra]|uniref:Uncharacterized protein n=1 Tax=Dovyalis caffra TaxID=77055 RepID=A0AAV1R6E4_9ROSI|nr:unnamed protein product [Dovyalis caffra]